MQPLRTGDPERLGRWMLVGRIDRGAGVVAYEATSGGRRAVLEVFELGRDPDLAAEQLRGILPRLAELDEGVAAVLDAGVEGHTGWIATLQPDIPTIGASVLASGPLSREAWDQLANSLLAVLERVHNAGLVHGRITPDSVVLSQGSAVVVDLGLTQAVDAAGAPGALPARVAWMTPEQIAGERPVAASDVFAAGSLLALAATGRRPWGPPTAPMSQLVTRIARGECDLDGASTAQSALIGALLRPDPDSRPTAAEALSLCPVAPVLAVSRPEAGGPLADPDPVTQLDVAPRAAVSLASSGSVPATPPTGATSEPDLTRAATRRRSLVIAAVLALVLVGAAAVAVGVSRQQAAPSQNASRESSAAPARPSPSAAPATPSPSATTGEAAPSASTVPIAPPSYTTRVNYSNRNIPDALFPGTLGWSFDVCLSDLGTARPGIKRAIAMYKAEDRRWRRQNAQASAARGGRCGQDRVNVTIDSTAIPPTRPAPVGSWNPCAKYRVVIPETSRFAKTSIDFCVQTRLDKA